MLTQRTDFTSHEAASHLFPLNMIDHQDGLGKLAGDRKDQENSKPFKRGQGNQRETRRIRTGLPEQEGPGEPVRDGRW